MIYDSNMTFEPSPFIVGTGRCGTTLLRAMLDAHPALAIAPETDFIPQLARRCSGGPDSRACFIDVLTQSPRWPHFRLDADALRARLDRTAPFELGTALRGFYQLYAERFGKPRWGDTTPAHHAHMRLIQQLLPEARFVHLMRDGRDVALSVLPMKQRGDPTARLEDAAMWWVARLKRARDEARGVHHYLEVRYEDLILDTEPTLRQICEFVELPWHPAMLRYHDAASTRTTHENHTERTSESASTEGDGTPGPRRPRNRLADAPDPERIGRWREEMTANDLQRVEAIAGSLLRDLGYFR